MYLPHVPGPVICVTVSAGIDHDHDHHMMKVITTMSAHQAALVVEESREAVHAPVTWKRSEVWRPRPRVLGTMPGRGVSGAMEKKMKKG